MSKEQLTTSKRLIHNTIFNVAAHFMNSIIGFVLISFFLEKLGQERYGIWVLVGSIFRYRNMLSMGLNSAVNRNIPVYLAEDDDQKLNNVISTSFFYYLIAGILIFFLTILIYFNVDSWFKISPEYVGTAGVLILIVGLCFSIVMPLQLFTAVLSGLQRYDIINVTEVSQLIIRTVLMVFLMMRGYGLITMGIVFGVNEIVCRTIQLFYYRKLLPQAVISIKYIDFKLLISMVAYGTNTLLYTMGALILYKASDLIIAIFIGTAQVSRFAIAAAGVLLLSQMIQSFLRAIKPAISDLHARNKSSHISEAAFLSQKYCLLIIIPAITFLVLMGEDFLGIWVGDEINDPQIISSMAAIMSILAIGNGFRMAQHSNFVILVGRGDHKVFGFLTALAAVMFIVISVICLKVFNLGLIAVAWSNFIPVVLISGIVIPIYFNYKMNIRAIDCLRNVWYLAIIGTMPTVLLIVAWKYFSTPESWTQIIAVVAVSALTTFVGAWLLSFKADERKRFLKIALRR